MSNVQPAPGDFGLVEIHGETGRLIRFGQWLCGDGYSDFEHAFLYIGNGEVVEAEPKGARKVSVGEYADADVMWSTGIVKLTPEQRTAICANAEKLVGTPYGFLDYFAIASHRLHLPWSLLLKKRVESGKTLICSQLVDYDYDISGAHLFSDNRWEGYITPGGLWRLLTGKVSDR